MAGDRLIPNERSLFRRISTDGFSRARPLFVELLVLAKDIRTEKGYGEIKIVKELSGIWLEQDENFNFTMEESLLRKVAREAIKSPEFKTPNYPLLFSAGEMRNLRSVKDFSCQRLFFSALAVAKSSGNPKLFSGSYKNVRLIVFISGENKTISDFKREASHCANLNGVFEHVKKRSSFYSVLLEQEEDIALSITSDDEFLSAGKIYKEFVGGALSWCEKCEAEFVKVSNRQRLCGTCSDVAKREKTRDRVAKHRDK